MISIIIIIDVVIIIVENKTLTSEL